MRIDISLLSLMMVFLLICGCSTTAEKKQNMSPEVVSPPPVILQQQTPRTLIAPKPPVAGKEKEPLYPVEKEKKMILIPVSPIELPSTQPPHD
jgi:hypothetical protein